MNTDLQNIAQMRPCADFEGAGKTLMRVNGAWVRGWYPLFVFPVHAWPQVRQLQMQGAPFPEMQQHVQHLEQKRLATERLRQLEEFTRAYQ
jgi:hypothetical protein